MTRCNIDPEFGVLRSDLFGSGLTDTQAHLATLIPTLSENDVYAIVEGIFNLVEDIKAGVTGETYNAEKLWFFQLCRRIQSFLDPAMVRAKPSDLLPFALLHVELLHREGLTQGSAY